MTKEINMGDKVTILTYNSKTDSQDYDVGTVVSITPDGKLVYVHIQNIGKTPIYKVAVRNNVKKMEK